MACSGIALIALGLCLTSAWIQQAMHGAVNGAGFSGAPGFWGQWALICGPVSVPPGWASGLAELCGAWVAAFGATVLIAGAVSSIAADRRSKRTPELAAGRH